MAASHPSRRRSAPERVPPSGDPLVPRAKMAAMELMASMAPMASMASMALMGVMAHRAVMAEMAKMAHPAKTAHPAKMALMVVTALMAHRSSPSLSPARDGPTALPPGALRRAGAASPSHRSLVIQ